ncbi:class I SAM-dependent methyltransferase [Pigmentiphaga soli]|uniref:Class I SAM-dependent methyltransferase n=1 Tax=Pigmentiphaga soli TaxID=1007095 RepID=A0ABP8GF27_9BURK
MTCNNAFAPDSSRTSALLELVRTVAATGYRFTTVTPATHQRVNARPDNAWARGLRDVFGWSRRFDPAILPAGLFDLMQQAGVAARDGDGWLSRVRLSTLDGQLYLHSAYPTIDEHSVFFGPDTYRYADAIRQWLPTCTAAIRRAVDIGCGAGPGAIVVALATPEAQVWGVDINEGALALARVNAVLAGASNMTASRSDLLRDIEGEFDLIVANPPYLADPQERAYRHGGGPLGAGLSLAIIDAAIGRLAPGGTLLLYTGAAIIDGDDPLRNAAVERLSRAGLAWTYREMDPDIFGEELLNPAYAQTERLAAVVLTATKR